MTAVLADGFAGLTGAMNYVKRRWPLGWRSLYALWATVLLVSIAGGAVLQYLGPPTPKVVSLAATAPASSPAIAQPAASPRAAVPAPAPTASAPIAPAARETAEALPKVAPVVPPGPAPSLPPGTVAPPDAKLQQASAVYPGTTLPRIGPDRRTPMQAYASPFEQRDTRPRIAILVAGIGMNEADSLAAIDTLPGAVSLAVSPYVFRPEALLSAARLRGHEYLVSIPMEPVGYPLNDPGNQALLTGAPADINARHLEWALTRFPGYVGATGALGDMRGERFAAAVDQMYPVLDLLADHGLLYVDPRPNGQAPARSPTQRGANRSVDLVLDDPPGRDELDAKLALLEQTARERGAAIGLAGRPSPVTIERIAAWAATLPARGITLAPVSVVVQMPKAPATALPMAAPPLAVRTGLTR